MPRIPDRPILGIFRSRGRRASRLTHQRGHFAELSQEISEDLETGTITTIDSVSFQSFHEIGQDKDLVDVLVPENTPIKKSSSTLQKVIRLFGGTQNAENNIHDTDKKIQPLTLDTLPSDTSIDKPT